MVKKIFSRGYFAMKRTLCMILVVVLVLGLVATAVASVIA